MIRKRWEFSNYLVFLSFQNSFWNETSSHWEWLEKLQIIKHWYIIHIWIYPLEILFFYTHTHTHTNTCILAFDPAKNAIPRWYTGRKWHILMAIMRGNRVDGNWLTKWDEVKKFPWYTHRLMHRKRVTFELHDSYFRLMTIKHAISKSE